MILSEGVMVAPTGYLMQHIYLRVFFLTLLISNLVLLVNSRFVLSLFEKEKIDNYENFKGKYIEEKEK